MDRETRRKRLDADPRGVVGFKNECGEKRVSRFVEAIACLRLGLGEMN